MKQRGRKSATSLEIVRPQWHDDRPRPALDPPQPPPHLGKPERKIWGDVFDDFTLDSGVSIAILTTALEAHQRAREAREAVLKDGMTVTGRDGQSKVHPLLSVERDARQAWLAGIKALGLEL